MSTPLDGFLARSLDQLRNYSNYQSFKYNNTTPDWSDLQTARVRSVALFSHFEHGVQMHQLTRLDSPVRHTVVPSLPFDSNSRLNPRRHVTNVDAVLFLRLYMSDDRILGYGMVYFLGQALRLLRPQLERLL